MSSESVKISKFFIVAICLYLVACFDESKSPKLGSKNRSDYRKESSADDFARAKMAIYNVPPEIRGFHLGQGFNSLEGVASLHRTSACIQGNRELGSTIVDTKGASINFSISHLTSTSDLFNKIGKEISANIGYKVGPIDVGGKALQKELNEFTLSKNYSYALIHGKKIFSQISLTDYVVKPDSLAFYSRYPERFYGNCGDEFVSGVTLGAEVIAIVECRTDSQVEKHEVDKEIDTHVTGDAFNAGAKIKVLMEQVTKKTKNGCVIKVEAKGRETGTINVSLGEFAQSVVDYVSNASMAEGVPIFFDTRSYDKVANQDFQDYVIGRGFPDLTAAKSHLKIIESKLPHVYDILELKRSQLKFTTDPTERQAIEKEIKKIVRKINDWRKRKEEIVRDPVGFMNDDWDVAGDFDATGGDGEW